MRPHLHLIEKEDVNKVITTYCGRSATPYYSVFAEADGNCIVCARVDGGATPSCPVCLKNAKSKGVDV